MLAQALTLGLPLDSDRAELEQVVPSIERLRATLEQAIASCNKSSSAIECAAESTGARIIDWSAPRTANTAQTEPSNAPAPAESASTRPVIRMCAERLMENLRSDAVEFSAHSEEVTLQGTNKTLAIPSVFEFVSRTQKTGSLRIRTNDETLRFEFVSGDIVYSETNNPPGGQRLGELMVQMGFVTQDNLDAFLTSNPRDRLGAALESGELIDRESLQNALFEQVRLRLERAFDADESAFTFLEGGPSTADQRVRMNVAQLLLHQMR